MRNNIMIADMFLSHKIIFTIFFTWTPADAAAAPCHFPCYRALSQGKSENIWVFRYAYLICSLMHT